MWVRFGVSSQRVRLIQHAGKRNNSWPAGEMHGDRAGACTSEPSLHWWVGWEWASMGVACWVHYFACGGEILFPMRPNLVRRIDQRVTLAIGTRSSYNVIVQRIAGK